MAKFVHDDVLSAACAKIADNCNKMYLDSADPGSNFTSAGTTYALADQTMTVGTGNGDYTIEDGTTSGRRCTVEQQSGVVVDSSGTATHVALADSGNSKVYVVTTMNATVLVAANTVTVAEWGIEFRDAA